MVLNHKSFQVYDDVCRFINSMCIPKENILALVPRGQFELHLYWWAENRYRF